MRWIFLKVLLAAFTIVFGLSLIKVLAYIIVFITTTIFVAICWLLWRMWTITKRIFT